MILDGDRRLAAGLLVAGFPVLMIGGAFWRLEFQQPDLVATLNAIARNAPVWLWIHFWLAAGVVVTASGLAGFAHVLAGAGDRVLGSAGATLFVLGGAPWLVAIAARVTVEASVAAEVERVGLPALYPAVYRGMGLLLGIHMVLAYLAAVLFGAAILRTRLLPAVYGWTGVAFGTAGLGALATFTGMFSAPLLAHVYPLLVGIGLRRAPFAGRVEAGRPSDTRSAPRWVGKT